MSNLNRDALSVVIPDQDMRDAKAKLSAIGQLFPFLIELSADEICNCPVSMWLITTLCRMLSKC